MALIPLGCLYFINLVSIIVTNVIFCGDLRFKKWYKSPGGGCSYLVFSLLSVVLSFKVTNVIFCNLFDAKIFKSKLQHPSRLFWLHIMSFLALTHSFWAIAIAAYNLYYTTNIATMLFYESIDLIIVASL